MNVNHYLVTLDLTAGPQHMHLHGYVMCKDKRAAEETANEMLDLAERQGLKPLPIILDDDAINGCRRGAQHPVQALS